MPAPTRQQVLDFGLPPTVASEPEALVEQTVIASGLIFRRGHGLGTDAPLSFRCVSSTTPGATASAPPGGLSEGVTYYVRPATSDSFRVATAVSPASAITTFSAEAVGRYGYVRDFGPALDAAIAEAWDIVQSDCTAHGGDVDAPILASAAKALAARLYIAIRCAGNPAMAASYAGISELYAEVWAPKQAAYFSGVEIRGATDATPGVTENGAVLVRPAAGAFGPPVQPVGSSLTGPLGITLGRPQDRV